MNRHTALTAWRSGAHAGQIEFDFRIPPVRYSRKSRRNWEAAVYQACQQLEAQTGVSREHIIVEWQDGTEWTHAMRADVLLK